MKRGEIEGKKGEAEGRSGLWSLSNNHQKADRRNGDQMER